MPKFSFRKILPLKTGETDPKARARIGAFAGWVGIATNLLLAGAKITVGVLFGAIAIVADGINNLTDSLSSLITLIGFRFSVRKADEEHPFGHGRMEYISTLLIAMVMVGAGVTLVQQSFPKIWNPTEAQLSLLLIGTLAGSILLKLGQAFFYHSMGRAIESDTLRANFRDSLNDVVSTTAILLSLGLTQLIGYNTDGVMGTLVALFVLYSGISLMRSTIRQLLGEGADPALAKRIEQLVLETPGIVGVHDLEVHSYGPGRLFASAHAEVPADQDVLVSHDRIDNIERQAARELGLQLTLHMDPVVTDDPELEALKTELSGILAEIGPDLQFHDLRLVRGETHTNAVFDLVIPYHFPLSDEETRHRVDQALSRQHPGYYTAISIDKMMIRENKSGF